MIMRRILLLFSILAAAAVLIPASSGSPEKEFLTAKEIELIQDCQEIDRRVKIYLDAAEFRLKEAEERLHGKESEAGDPFEFFSVEDMLDGYYRILRSVMLNLDAAFQKGGPDREKVRSALKNLKKTTERTAKDLEILKKIAEEKLKEELWNLVNKAIDITDGAHEGAESGLSRLPAAPSERKTKTR